MRFDAIDWKAAQAAAQKTLDDATIPEVKAVAEQLVAVVGYCEQLSRELDSMEVRANQRFRGV